MGSKKKRSKRRSRTTRKPRRPSKKLTFFVDRDLSAKTFLDLLRQSGLKVENHNDHFGQRASDPQWIRFAGKRGWIGLSHNYEIGRDREALQAIRQTPAGVIILVAHKLNHPSLASNLVRSLATVENWIAAHPAPFLAKFYRPSGKDLELDRPGTMKDWSEGRI